MSDFPSASKYSGVKRDRTRSNLGRSTYGLADDQAWANTLAYQQKELNRLDWQAQQAVNRGYISPDDYAASRQENHANVIQKMLGGIGMQDATTTGGGWETVGDILSLGSYAGASYAQAAFQSGKWVGFGPKNEQGESASLFLPGFMLPGQWGAGRKAFVDAWQGRTSWMKFNEQHEVLGKEGTAGNFAAGLAADIFLDPTTYMTFGVSKGLQVGIKAEVVGATKAVGAGRLDKLANGIGHLSGFGTEIYKRAAQRLNNELLIVAEKAGEKYGRHLLDNKELAQNTVNEIASYAVEHFDDLKAEYLKDLTTGKWAKAKMLLAPGSQAAQAAVLRMSETLGYKIGGFGVDDMFQESASFLGKERGLSVIPKGTKFIQRGLTKIPVAGDLFRGLFDTFDHGWDVSPEILEWARITKNRKELEFVKKVDEFQEVFGTTTSAEREQVTNIIEARSRFLEVGVGTPIAAAGRFDDATEKMVDFVSQQMDEIYELESEANIALNRVDDYIAHISNKKVRDYYTDAIGKNGEVNLKNASRFTHQRMIASIAEGEDLFGEGVFKKDAFEILVARKRASIEMLANQEFFGQVVKKHGVAQAIVHAVGKDGKGLARGIFNGWLRRAGYGVHEVLQVDQVYQAEHGYLKELGFKEGDFKGNVDRLKYLNRPNDDIIRESGTGLSGKFSPEGVSEAERLGLPEAARLHRVERSNGLESTFGPIPEGFRYTPMKLKEFDVRLGVIQGGRRSYDNSMPRRSAADTLAAFDDADHPMWKEVLRETLTGDATNHERIYGLLAGLNSYTVRWLDSQLPALVPDLQDRVLRILTKNGVEVDEAVENGVAKVISNFANPIEIRRVAPMLPPEVVELARATRRSAGIGTDVSPATKFQKGEIQSELVRLGFTADLKKQLCRALFDKDDFSTVQEADAIIETLRPLMQSKPVGAQTSGLGLSARMSDKIVPVEIKLARQVKDNPVLPSKYDQDLALEAAEGSVPTGSKVGKEIAEETEAALTSGRLPPEKLRLADFPSTSGESTRQAGKLSGGAVNEEFGEAEFLAVAKQELDEAQAKLQKLNADRTKRVHGSKGKYDQLYVELNKARGDVKKKAIEYRQMREKFEAARIERSKNASKGGVESGAKVAFGETTSDRLLRLRKLRNQANAIVNDSSNADNSIRNLTKLIEEGTAKGEDVAPYQESLQFIQQLKDQLVTKVGGTGIDATKVDFTALDAEIASLKNSLTQGNLDAPKLGTKGTKAPDSSPVNEVVYLPESVARYLEDFSAPGVDPTWSPFVKDMVKRYDALTQLYKTDMLTPFPAYWGRNGMTNAALTILKGGLSFLSPKDNFARGKASMATIMYSLGQYSDWPKSAFGMPTTKIQDFLDSMGSHVVKTKNGREVLVKDLMEEMRIRGITHGMQRAEMAGQDNLWGQVVSSLRGGGFGAGAGAVAGAGVNSVTGGEDADSYLGVLGGAIGLATGSGAFSKGLRKAGFDKGGIVASTVDGTAKTLQTGWKPLMRYGEAATEMPFRVHLFTNEFIETGSMSQAADAVYRYMGDYSSLSPFERRWLRRIVPFYGWTKTAISNSGWQMVENPGRLGAMFKTAADWNVYHDADPEDLPDFLHNKLAMVVGNTDGTKPYQYATPGILPIEEALTTASAFNFLPALGDNSDLEKERWEFFSGFGSKINFPVLAGAELLTGVDSFSGRPVAESPGTKPTDWDAAPAVLQKLVGYQPGIKGQTDPAIANPHLAWVLGKIPGGRLFSLVRQIQEVDEEGRKQLDTFGLARHFLGASAIRVDPNSQKYYVNNGKIRALKNLLDNVVVQSLGEAPDPSKKKTSFRYKRR